jgi:Tfp pilus assembly protein PilX
MRSSTDKSGRTGVALVIALVLMATLAVIMAVLAMQLFSQRQMARQRHNQLQAEWLARAGVEVAAARILEKPASFTEEQTDLAPDSKVRIVVEKTGDNIYQVTTEAEVGTEEKPVVVRTAGVQFRRMVADGAVRLEALPLSRKDRP